MAGQPGVLYFILFYFILFYFISISDLTLELSHALKLLA